MFFKNDEKQTFYSDIKRGENRMMVNIFGKVVAVCVAILVFGSVAYALDSEFTRKTMKGLQGVYVLVEELQPNIQKYGIKAGLKKELLQADIESILKAGGIKVLNREAWLKTPGNPVLYVNINTHETEKYWYGYDVRVEMQQVVSLEAHPKTRLLVGTWTTNMTGAANIGSLGNIRNAVQVMVGKFVQAYKEENRPQ